MKIEISEVWLLCCIVLLILVIIVLLAVMLYHQLAKKRRYKQQQEQKKKLKGQEMIKRLEKAGLKERADINVPHIKPPPLSLKFLPAPTAVAGGSVSGVSGKQHTTTTSRYPIMEDVEIETINNKKQVERLELEASVGGEAYTGSSMPQNTIEDIKNFKFIDRSIDIDKLDNTTNKDQKDAV